VSPIRPHDAGLLFDPRPESGRPLVIGHRGFPVRAPENTIPSFLAAVDAGADMIELDVTLSADRQLVVIHDSTLDRTTDGQGLVCLQTLDRLRTLDAGAWFGPQFQGVRLPTLEEVFETLGRRVLIDVEIKREAISWPDVGFLAVRLVVDLILRHGLLDRVMVSSFSYDALREARALEPGLGIGVLADRPERNLDAVKLCQAVAAFSYHPYVKDLDADRVGRLQGAGLKVIPWADASDDEAACMEMALELGCDGYFANDVRLWGGRAAAYRPLKRLNS